MTPDREGSRSGDCFVTTRGVIGLIDRDAFTRDVPATACSSMPSPPAATRPSSVGTRPLPALVAALLAFGCASVPHSGPAGPRIVHRVEQYQSSGWLIAADHYSAVHPTVAPMRRPAVILLHGSGGLNFGGGRSIRRYARALASRGFETFVVHYFDRTRTWVAGGPSERRNFSRWVETVSDGITHAAHQPGVDSTRIGIVGVSLGAYLAVGAAAEDRRVTAVVDISGGLEPFLADRVTRLPPALILHGSHDKVVPVAEAFLLALYLSLRDLHYEMRIYEGEGHQFAASTEVDALARSSEFLLKASAEGSAPAHLETTAPREH
jgi:dienelactone hydrolase